MAKRALPLVEVPAAPVAEPAESSIRRRLAKGVAWTIAGSIVAQGGSFLTAVVLARILGREVYGQFALVLSTLVAITTLASLGLGVTATKYVSEYRASDPSRVGRILGLSSLVALVAALAFAGCVGGLAPWLTLSRSAPAAVVWGFRWGAVYVFFTTVNGYQMGALAGFERFRTIAYINIAYGIAGLLSSAVLGMWLGLRGAVLSQGACAALLWLLYDVALRRECRLREIQVDYAGARWERPVLLQFSLPSAACGVVMTLAMWWCSAQLVKLSGYAEMAMFAAVNNLRLAVIFVPALVGRVGLPLLNNLAARRQFAAYRRMFWKLVGVNGVFALALSAAVCVAGPQILRLFGKDFVPPVRLLVLLMSAVVVEVIATTLFQALFTSGRIWRNLAIVTAWAMVLVASLLTGITGSGAAGLAGAYLCAWFLAAGLYGVSARRQCS